MNGIKSFFGGIFLLMAVLAMIVLSALIYRASERSTIKSYIFETANSAQQRIGELQNMNDMSANDLRNRLIKKYVAEYFKVIPGDKSGTDRPSLRIMSGGKDSNAFNYWKSNEAKKIEEMSAKKMFRIARVHDDGIATYNKSEADGEDTSGVYYKVRYYMSTWSDSNTLETEPIYEQGTLYLEIDFEPVLRPTIELKKYNLRKYLESGKDPAVLFKFRVNNIRENTKK